ncbi:hypothetical protein PF002_g31569 [Phytophthora fragariae]|uniref:Uncharacterized protein n=1 Tax=Phytophthora fragariae TaxID=53985 RepID=A0A6A3VBL3_9STRA|nr:hypothetical protein PF002_g31569 [Phytophthora fragariae]
MLGRSTVDTLYKDHWYTVPIVVCDTQFLWATLAGVAHIREHLFSLKRTLANPGPITPSLTQTGSTFPRGGESNGNASTASFGNSRSSEHTRTRQGPLGTTTETRIIVRPAPDALRAVGPIQTHADAPTPSDIEEKPPAPASKKHSGDPEAVKAASASKKLANDTEKETPASKKHAKDAGEAKKPASQKPKVAAAKAKKTPASPKAMRKAKKMTASSKPAPKKPVVKKPAAKPAAKQLPKTKGASKEGPKTLKLPPKRTDVLLPGPHEDVSSDSSDTDTPNPGYVGVADSPAPRARTSTKDHAASANDATTSPPGRSPSPHPSLEVDYKESEPDVDHEDGEVEWSPKRITDAQRVLHPGSPMSPKTVVAVERARLLEESLSRLDDPPAAVSEPQVITNAGVDEGVPPELLQPENRQHLADPTRAAILDSGRVP